MKLSNIETDVVYQSLLQYGTPEFPFAYFYDEINRYHENSINWHWHDGLELSFVIAGPVDCYIANEMMTLQSGDILFVNQGSLHRFVSSSGGLMINFVFDTDFIAPIGSWVYTNYVIPIISSAIPYAKISGDDPSGKEILTSLIRTQNELEIKADAWELRIKSHIMNAWNELYLYLKEQITQAQNMDFNVSNRTYHRIRKMLNFIHEHYAENLTLDLIAESTNISKSEVLRSFKSGLHTTPLAYVTQYRLSRAKDLLKKGDDSVLQVALKCGFDNSSYFCKVFKKNLGMSPLDFCDKYSDKRPKI